MTIETKSIATISAESLKIRDLLRKTQNGQIVTDSEIESAAGRSYAKIQGHIRSAVNALAREQIVFYRVRKTGWKRAETNTSEIIEGERGVTKAISRKVKKSLRRLACVEFDKLNNDDKLRHSAVSAQIGAIAMFSNSKASDKIQAATIGNGKQPEVAKVLELFR